MEFWIYDVAFLVLFSLGVAWFLWKNRKNLGKEGIFYIYRTKWGMRLIKLVGKKYGKILDALRYLILPTSYILMIGIIYFIGKTLYYYIWDSLFIEVIGKSPPLALVIPYFPKIFGYENVFPPFYFTYFLLAIAIVAIVHEFSHGIFMSRYNIKIKSTGIAFLGPILGAFVEQDEKDMKKAKKLDQMTVLGAGVFANLVFAILFLLISIAFFNIAFTPSGVVFDTYAYSIVGIANITSINGISLANPSYENILNLMDEKGFSKIKAEERGYLITKKFLEKQKGVGDYVALYADAPAINAELKDAIHVIEHQGKTTYIQSVEELTLLMQGLSVGEKINITTKSKGVVGTTYYDIELTEHPDKEGLAWLGIGFYPIKSSLPKPIYHFLSSTIPQNLYVVEHVYHKPKVEGLSEFVYYLFWWIVMLNFLVALFNMLPLGILDGGRFFYLTILGITGSKKAGDIAYKLGTWLLLIVLFLFMAVWIFRLF